MRVYVKLEPQIVIRCGQIHSENVFVLISQENDLAEQLENDLQIDQKEDQRPTKLSKAQKRRVSFQVWIQLFKFLLTILRLLIYTLTKRRNQTQLNYRCKAQKRRVSNSIVPIIADKWLLVSI